MQLRTLIKVFATEFLIDPGDKILWVNLTEDYRAHARPE
jgi:hypothetical protein